MLATLRAVHREFLRNANKFSSRLKFHVVRFQVKHTSGCGLTRVRRSTSRNYLVGDVKSVYATVYLERETLGLECGIFRDV